LLKTLPDTPERSQQELTLQIALGAPLIITKGFTAPEVERVCIRALELCRQLGETPKRFGALERLYAFYHLRAELRTAREWAEQCLSLAQNIHNPIFPAGAHFMLGNTLYYLGEFALAREHLEEGIALYDPQQHHFGTLDDPWVDCLCTAGWVLWVLGYPDQALQRSHEGLTLAQELSRPYYLAFALDTIARFHMFRWEVQATQEWAEASLALAREQGFPYWLASGTILWGWTLAEQGQVEEGILQIRQGMSTLQAMGTELSRPYFLALLAGAYGKVGQVEEGLTVLDEALALVDRTGERTFEAELYRFKGQITLQSKTSTKQVEGKSKASRGKSAVTYPQLPTPNPQAEAEAEACFHKAIEVARRQQAKSWELRATVSLARLWQSQGKRKEAHKLLIEIYGWFTEGFDRRTYKRRGGYWRGWLNKEGRSRVIRMKQGGIQRNALFHASDMLLKIEKRRPRWKPSKRDPLWEKTDGCG
jgi:predicted ATPase